MFRCVRLPTYHHIVPMSRNLGALTLLDPSGPAWPVMGVLYLYRFANWRHFFYALHDLLNDAVSSLEYVASTGMMCNEYSVVKSVKGCGSGVI
jgi:hypothetical protein